VYFGGGMYLPMLLDTLFYLSSLSTDRQGLLWARSGRFKKVQYANPKLAMNHFRIE